MLQRIHWGNLVSALSLCVGVQLLAGCQPTDGLSHREETIASNPAAATSKPVHSAPPTAISNVEVTTAETPTADDTQAVVTAVTVTGSPSNYTFQVTIVSPDTGCEQYADWWEVISPSGELIYRRVLLHSHVNEKPFTRSGRPANFGPSDDVIVRAHMNNTGYGTQAMQGSVSAGFEAINLPENFAAEASKLQPLPQGCNF